MFKHAWIPIVLLFAEKHRNAFPSVLLIGLITLVFFMGFSTATAMLSEFLGLLNMGSESKLAVVLLMVYESSILFGFMRGYDERVRIERRSGT